MFLIDIVFKQIKKKILEKIISKDKSIIMLCGPKSFVNNMYQNLINIGIDINHIVVFCYYVYYTIQYILKFIKITNMFIIYN